MKDVKNLCLRMPMALYEKVLSDAQSNSKSVTSYILDSLQGGPQALQARISELEEQIQVQKRTMEIIEQMVKCEQKEMQKMLNAKIITVKGNDMDKKILFTVIFKDRHYKIWADTTMEAFTKVRELDPEMDEVCKDPKKDHGVEILFTDPNDGTLYE